VLQEWQMPIPRHRSRFIIGIGRRSRFCTFNGDPESLNELVSNPERIYVMAPGEPFTLHPLKDSAR
jgi:hypothetical protein